VLREQLRARSKQPIVGQVGPSMDSRLDAIAGPEHRSFFGPPGPPTLSSVRMQLVRLLHSIENADVAPTAAQQDAYTVVSKPLPGLMEQWKQMKQKELQSLNEQLRQSHLAAIDLEAEVGRGVKDKIEVGDED